MSNEKQIFQPNPVFSANARIKSMDEYYALQKEANDDYEGFWDRFAKENTRLG